MPEEGQGNRTEAYVYGVHGGGARTRGKENQKEKNIGILCHVTGWRMAADSDKWLAFPDIVPTAQRPDILLWSPRNKEIVAPELTVPWEERSEEAHERERSKYDTLMADCRQQGLSQSRWDAEALRHSLHGGCFEV